MRHIQPKVNISLFHLEPLGSEEHIGETIWSVGDPGVDPATGNNKD